jgi:hypothetical protein
VLILRFSCSSELFFAILLDFAAFRVFYCLLRVFPLLNDLLNFSCLFGSSSCAS